jgi:transcriptional regulator with XRE-family HTH domain
MYFQKTIQSCKIESGDNMSIGQRLKQARGQKGYTQRQVADKLGVHSTTISKHELDTAEPDSEALLQLAKIYGVSVEWIMYGHEDKNITETILKDIVQQTGVDLTIPRNKEILIDLIKVVLNSQKQS